MSRPPRPLPHHPITLVAKGMMYPIEAIGFIGRHDLWGLTGAAIAINVVLLVGLLGLTGYFLVPQLEYLDQWLMGASDASWLQPIMTVVSWIVWAITVMMAIVCNALLLMLVGQAVASPFLEALSERTEAIVLDRQPEPASAARVIRGIVLAVADIIWTLIFLMAINVPIWILGVVLPVVGTSASAVLSFAFTALILSMEFVTLPLCRQLIGYRQRWATIWRNRWLSLGFGTMTMGLLVMPGLNLVLLPLAACGGTLLYCDLHHADRLAQQKSLQPQPKI